MMGAVGLMAVDLVCQCGDGYGAGHIHGYGGANGSGDPDVSADSGVHTAGNGFQLVLGNFIAVGLLEGGEGFFLGDIFQNDVVVSQSLHQLVGGFGVQQALNSLFVVQKLLDLFFDSHDIFLLSFILGFLFCVMFFIGNVISGTYALVVMLLLSLPFTAIYVVIYNKLFKKKHSLTKDGIQKMETSNSFQKQNQPATGSKTVDIIIMVLLIVSLVANVYLYLKNNEYTQTIQTANQANTDFDSELKTANATIISQIKELKQCYDQLEIYNNIIVFVENDKTRLYHRYSCEKFIGEDFWAYNVEYAESKGYKPCELCHNSGNLSLGFSDEVNYLLMESIVGEDHEITVAEIKNLTSLDFTNLVSSGTVFTCRSWSGLYHTISCERLEGICNTYLPQFAELDGFNPCPKCFE